MNNYERRWNNAKRIAERINSFIDDGYMVFDDDGEVVGRKFIITDYDISYPIGENSNLIYFINDVGLDNGIHTVISEYNKQFSDWKVVYPYDIQKLDL